MKNLDREELFHINGGSDLEIDSEWELYQAYHNPLNGIFGYGREVGKLAGSFLGWVANGVTRYIKW